MVADMTYYTALEVSATCSATDLKKSYRRLCLVHHPDKGGDAERFQQIQQAWEVLSDEDARAHYDEYGLDKPGQGGPGDMDDFFEQMFGGGMGGMGGGPGPRRRPDRKTEPTRPSVVQLHVTLEELYMGKEKTIAVERSRTCGTCSGTGAKPRAQRRTCVKCRGAGQVHALRQMGPYMTRVPVTCPGCDGEGYSFRSQDACKKCQGARTLKEKKKVTVHVERGSVDGEVIVLHGEGDESPQHTSPSALHIHLLLLPHPTFTLLPSSSSSHPSNLSTTLSITLSESLLGFSRLILQHLDGRSLRATAPPPGQKGWRVLRTGDELTIKGEGMWRRGEMGDLRVKIEVEMPDERWAAILTAEQLGALRKALPEGREDLTPALGEKGAGDVEEVTLQEVGPEPEATYGADRPRASDDEYEDEDYEGGAPGCHQQ